MKNPLSFILPLLALIFCTVASAHAQPAKKSDLKILYVGGSAEIYDGYGSTTPKEVLQQSVQDRMKAFESFLNDYFTSVTVIKADEYTQQMSDNYDVTVMDGRPKPIIPRFSDQANGIYLQAGYLTEDFDRPMITIGEQGEAVGRRIGLKNDWYCLCLDADAHHWRAEHPVFNGPFDVKLTVQQKPTPEDAYHYPYYYDGPIPDQIPMWTVQTKGYKTDEGFRVGMVARPWGYEDSPEAEYISSGVCAKTLDAVAIGRHANFLHWGFAASPAYMTEQAKPVLANAIVYISKFAGQKPIARKYNDRIATREYLKELKEHATRESYEERLKSDAEWNAEMYKQKEEAIAKQEKGETLSANDQQMLTFEASPQMTFDAYLKRYNKDFYPVFGTDTDAYIKFYDENRDYFYGEGFYHIELDEDVKSLGIPNNDKRILDEAIKTLESGRDVEKSKRILERYTLVDFSTPQQWRKWYDQYADRLFFTEAGGWVFLINSQEPGLNDYRAKEIRRNANRIELPETSDAEPVAVQAVVKTMQDGIKMLYVKMKVQPGYHIYSTVGQTDPFLATTVDVVLPEGYTAASNMVTPFGKFYNQSGTTVYEDEVVFRQEFTGQGSGELKCTVSYQCCDAHICFPPQEKEFVIAVEPAQPRR